MSHNVDKIFNSTTQNVKKPWFFFHIIYLGEAGQYKDDFSIRENFTMYYLFEDVADDENKRVFLLKLNEVILNIAGGLETDEAWNRYVQLEKTITDGLIRQVLKELFSLAWKLPTEVNGLIANNKLSLQQARRLLQIRQIMNVSPVEFVDKMIEFTAKEIVRDD